MHSDVQFLKAMTGGKAPAQIESNKSFWLGYFCKIYSLVILHP